MEPTGQLSNLCPTMERMLAKKKSQVSRAVASPWPGVKRQKHVHLSLQQQADLVARYQSGATQGELGAAYGIERRTVIAIVKTDGAQKEPRLPAAQIQGAAERYDAGDSLAAITRSFAVAANTVRARLLAEGVTMRSTAGVRT